MAVHLLHTQFLKVAKNHNTVYVDANELPNPENEFVCWIDIMGSQSIMTISIMRASNFLFKFHACALRAITDNDEIKYYPVMDGIYISSRSLTALQNAVRSIFRGVANIFTNETTPEHRFVIRGAIAYGPVIHGEDISADCCAELYNAQNGYKNNLFLGIALTQCYNGESMAPPFGVYLHDTAIAFGRMTGRFFSWWDKSTDIDFIKKLSTDTKDYFDWCGKYIYSTGMDRDKIDKYKALCTEYFMPINNTKSQGIKYNN